MSKRAIVNGGSIGGLFAAAALQKRGWDVHVYERVPVELAGRGAGIVTHDVLIEALDEVGADLGNLGVEVRERVAFDKSGARVATMPYDQIVTSWDHIHQKLRALVPDDHYHLGKQLDRYEQTGGGVVAHFMDGGSVEADVLVGADGFRSAVRQQMIPQVQPQYAGYVVWRALAHEADLPQDVLDHIFPTFAFYAPSGTQIIGYPIAGAGNDLRPGHRRYNFVWYSQASDQVLDAMLTDASGHRHGISIPPPLIRDDVLADMRAEAEGMLPAAFVSVLDRSERPFFTPIYDHHSPIMAEGRVALAGDAACGARPHVGMGVTKAAQDALALARHLEAGVLPGLQAYSAERVPASQKAHDRGRMLGKWIFEGSDGNMDGSAHARLDDIMQLTAVTVGA